MIFILIASPIQSPKSVPGRCGSRHPRQGGIPIREVTNSLEIIHCTSFSDDYSPPTITNLVEVEREGSPTPKRWVYPPRNHCRALNLTCRPNTLHTEIPEEHRVIIPTPSKLSHHLPQTLEIDAEHAVVENEDIRHDSAKDDVEHPFLTLNADERSSLITARAVQLSRAFDTCKTVNSNRFVYSLPAPTVSELNVQLQTLGIPDKIYQVPHYSMDSDIPETSKEYAGLSYHLKGGQGIASLDEWSTSGLKDKSKAITTPELDPLGVGGWEYASHPPSVKDVRLSIPSLFQSVRDGKKKPRSQVRI